MPVSKIIVQELILTLSKSLAQTGPACSNRLLVVVNATFRDEMVRHVTVAVVLLFHLYDNLIFRVKVGSDLLGLSSTTSLETLTFWSYFSTRG